MPAPTAFDQLLERLHTVSDLRATKALLEWDQETYMPSGAAESRAHQLATLEQLAHELFTADDTGNLIDRAAQETGTLDPGTDEASLVRITRRDYDRLVKLPTSLVTEFAQVTARALEAWKRARAGNDFAHFEPHLTRIVELNRKKAEALGYQDKIYDALLDEYEPAMRTSTVDAVFSDLRKKLVPIVEAIAAEQAPDDRFLHSAYDRQKQWDFGVSVIRDFGYDFDHGRQDISSHPFSTSFSTSDVRITTRVQERFFSTALFGSMHECGHALYDAGIDPALDRTPLASGTSLGIHESQSRMWENLVGRSRGFWNHYYPTLQRTFPDNLSDVTVDKFYRAVNRVAPTLIRVESDEVTYNLHIMLRFELENALLEDRIAISDIPEAWNESMRTYLGVTPDSDANGCLQDIHWAMGAMGYFPTYALGNLMSVQLFDRALADIDDLEEQIAAGRFTDLLAWLRENVHRHGRKRSATEILTDVTGQGLTADNWLAYVRKKFGAVYGIAL